MKKHILTVAATALLAIPTISFAESRPEGKPEGRPEGKPHGRAHLNPQERLERMTKALDLTAEQQEKIRAILEKTVADMKALREGSDGEPSKEDREKFRALMQAEREAIGEVLTPEQKEKVRAKMEEGKKQRGERGDKDGPRRPRGEKRPAGKPGEA